MCHADLNAAPVGELDGVPDQVVEYLTDLAFEAQHGMRWAEALGYLNVAIDDSAVLNGKAAANGVHRVQGSRAAGLTMKAQGLAADRRDATQFSLGGAQILAALVEILST